MANAIVSCRPQKPVAQSACFKCIAQRHHLSSHFMSASIEWPLASRPFNLIFCPSDILNTLRYHHSLGMAWSGRVPPFLKHNTFIPNGWFS